MPSCRTVAEVLSGVLQDFRPDLVLYDAGVDPHADDKLGRLKLTDSGLMRREMQVSVMLALQQLTCNHMQWLKAVYISLEAAVALWLHLRHCLCTANAGMLLSCRHVTRAGEIYEHWVIPDLSLGCCDLGGQTQSSCVADI